MKLSELLRQYREENNISQREFARRSGLSNSLISLIEMGRNPQTGKEMSPDLETYRKIADGMQISLQSLFMQLGNDATVNLSGDPQNSLDVGAAWYAAKLKSSGISTYSDKDKERLEALHQNPRLGLLFDRSRKMSHEDVELMIAMSERILKERDGDD